METKNTRIRNRVFVAIELANINGALNNMKNAGLRRIRLDLNELVKKLSFGSEIVEKIVYVETRENNYNFIHFLKRNGFTVVTKEPKKIVMKNGDTKLKANFDVEITMDVLRHVWLQSDCDEIFLCSGDSDFACLVDEVKGKSISITSVASQRTVSTEMLDRVKVIFLEDIMGDIQLSE